MVTELALQRQPALLCEPPSIIGYLDHQFSASNVYGNAGNRYLSQFTQQSHQE